MLKIKLPATTANLAVGFDSLAMALNIYNEFHFEASNEFVLTGFESSKNNLVLSSYLAFAKTHCNEVQPIEIIMANSNIPVSRGLGSSATCILAGVLAANHFNNLNKSYLECVAFTADLEGHPDNVYACAYGGLVAVFKEEEEYYYTQLEVSKTLKFQVLIPNEHGSTKELRTVLPKEVKIEDAVYNISRSLLLPSAFLKGDFKLLKMILKDKLHQPYRFPYIPKYNDIALLNENENNIVLISGSGPTVLLITPTTSTTTLTSDLLKVFKVIEVEISDKTQVEVLT